MIDDDFRVEVIGHATLRVQCGGRTLLTDPWLVDPIGNSGFHFPPLRHDPAGLAAETDAIYISHIHPDHFNPATLAQFPRELPIYIGAYRRKTFRDAIRRLGCRVIEVPFQEAIAVDGTDLEIVILEHDCAERAAYDSAIVIRAPDFTLFENNDCVLSPEKYSWVREHYAVDYAFLGYSPASSFPIAFELAAPEKARLLAEAAERWYGALLSAAAGLAPQLTIPFANGLRFLAAGELWRNVAFNSATEAAGRLRERGLAAEVLGPGDRIRADGSIARVGPVLGRDDELAAIDAYAQRHQDWVAGLAKRQPPARADLVDRFRDYLLALREQVTPRLPGVCRYVIAYVLLGPPDQRFYFDFSQPDGDAFHWGEPARYDMRYTYPASALQQRLDGAIDWDELHFTAASVHQVRFAREFYMMLRSEMLDLD
jgi:hypothetical protein